MIGGRADVVLSDMAPNTTGHRKTDQLRILGLVEGAAAFAAEVLNPGGTFVAKVFQSGADAELMTQLKRDYATVRHVKPASSRAGFFRALRAGDGISGRAGETGVTLKRRHLQARAASLPQMSDLINLLVLDNTTSLSVGDASMDRDFRHRGIGVGEGPNLRAFGFRSLLAGALLGIMASPVASAPAADQVAPQPPPQTKPTDAPKIETPVTADAPGPSFRAAVRAMVEQEVRKTGLPADIADAVVQVESNYNPRVIGGVGEIGLMQIRPQTAAMLGFRGSAEDLAKPEVNIHYGVTYLSKAWRLANGDLCRTLMKYRAGHGENVMTPRSVNYCRRAKIHLAELGSPLAEGTVPPAIIPASVLANNQPKSLLISPKDVYAQYRQGTPAASRAFWVAQETRVRAIKARIEARWHRRMASR